MQSKLPDPDEIPNDGIKTFTFKKIGKTGLERSFDEQLSGSTGMEIWRVDPLGFQDSRLEFITPKQGKNLITSIDIDLQQAAEIALGERTEPQSHSTSRAAKSSPSPVTPPTTSTA